MSELGFHVMLRSDDDRVLAPSPALRRGLARSLYRVATGFPLTAFGAADNHLHLEVLGDRAMAGDLAHRVMCSLHWALELPVEFAPVRYKRLEDQGHKRSTFHYTLNQRNRHGVQSDPFLDASSLPELLGMRVLDPGDSVRLVSEHFPRVQRGGLLRHLDLEVLEPTSDAQVRALVDAGREDLLRDSAAGAVGVANLLGRTPEVVAARTALVQLLAGCCTAGEIGDLVERTGSVVRRARHRPRQPRLEHATRLQIALRLWLLETRPELLDPSPGRLPDCSAHNPGP